MFKNVKIVVKTSALISLFLIVSFVWLWKLVDNESTTLVDDTITSQMVDAVESRAYIIDNYVQTAEDFLVAYAKSDEVRNALLNPEDTEVLARAQEYTKDYANVKGCFEGLYVCDYGTTTLVHMVDSTVGRVLRSGDDLVNFQQTVLGGEYLTNKGVLLSPSSGKMVISMYYPVFEDGKAIGFVGAAVYANQLMESLESLQVEGLPNSEYVFLNVNTGEYLYNKDESLLCTVTTENGYIDMLDTIKADPSTTTGIVRYTDDKGVEQVVLYRNIPSRNWVFAIKDTKNNIFGRLDKIKKTTATSFIIMGVVTTIILVIALMGIGRQLNKIKNAIEQLGNMDLSADNILAAYSDRGDEIGIICKAINKTCSNLREYIGDVDRMLSEMAQGDFSRSQAMNFEGDFVTLQNSLKTIQGELSNSFRDINTITSELVLGSESVENSASSLANAAVQANALISEIDENVTLISDQLSVTVEDALNAKNEAKDAERLVEISREKMEELSKALEAIQESAAAIETISNNLEDVAKQTNILSLNALVEASRAGDAGRGFSVVANEIRNLAEQSGEASVNAYELIAKAIASVKEGMAIGVEAADCLEKVVNQTNTIDNSVSRIADATEDQNKMLKDIRSKLGNISQTVETTAAMAEQSAAASTELDGQINALKDNINQFRV